MKGCMAIDRQKRKRFIGTLSSPPPVRRRRCVTGWKSWVWSVFAGTDGVEAVDVPEVAGGGAGDCGGWFLCG